MTRVLTVLFLTATFAASACAVGEAGTDAGTGELCTTEDQDAGLCTPITTNPSQFLVSTGPSEIACGYNTYTYVRLRYNAAVTGVSFSIQSSVPSLPGYGDVPDSVLGHWASIQANAANTLVEIDSRFPATYSPIATCTHGSMTSLYNVHTGRVTLVFVPE